MSKTLLPTEAVAAWRTPERDTCGPSSLPFDVVGFENDVEPIDLDNESEVVGVRCCPNLTLLPAGETPLAAKRPSPAHTFEAGVGVCAKDPLEPSADDCPKEETPTDVRSGCRLRKGDWADGGVVEKEVEEPASLALELKLSERPSMMGGCQLRCMDPGAEAGT